MPDFIKIIMIDPFSIIIIGLFVIFFSGLIAGLTGFGFSLVSVPLMIIFLPPKIVVPIILIHSVLINMLIFFEARKWLDLKMVWPLMIAGIIGMPFGTYLLMFLDVSVLKVFIGSIITIFSIAFLKGLQKKIKNERLGFAPVGFISGLLNGSTTMSGPPVILFFTNQRVKKQVFRANLVAYFTVLNLATIPAFIVGGLITTEVINYTLLFLIAMVVGSITGIKLAHKIKEKLFRNIALFIVTIAGLLSVLSGLGIL